VSARRSGRGCTGRSSKTATTTPLQVGEKPSGKRNFTIKAYSDPDLFFFFIILELFSNYINMKIFNKRTERITNAPLKVTSCMGNF
jgi:hypothetical protein